MQVTAIIKENWLTHRPREKAFGVSFALALLLVVSNVILFRQIFFAQNWMPATAISVFSDHQYWRLWTALFAHADMGHLLSNILLFLPLTFLLSGYYSATLFPLAGIFTGGIINLVVLQTLPLQTTLMGMSGVVYWMGAVWLTLYVLIDRRRSLKHRLAVATFLSVLLFAPETYVPQISYLSHALGFLFGIFAGAIYYFLNRQKFMAAEVIEYKYDSPEDDLHSN